MIQSPAQQAAEVLDQAAVKFDTERKYNNQNAWPFWYPFIPKPYLNTDTLNAGKGLLGFTVRPGRTVQIPIQIDRDTVYRMINIKYTPFRCVLGTAIDAPNTITTVAGSTALVGVGTTFTTTLTAGQPFAWTDDAGVVKCRVVESITDNLNAVFEVPADSVATGVLLFRGMFSSNYGTDGTRVPRNTFRQRPLTQMLRTTVVMTSLRSRYLLGGSQEFLSPDTTNSGNQERPLLISSLQGIDDGLGQIRTHAIFGYDSSVLVKVTNIFTEDIILNGTLFGYKIST